MFRKRRSVKEPTRPEVRIATRDEAGGFVFTFSERELVTLDVGDKVTIRSNDSSGTLTIKSVEPSEPGEPIRFTLTRDGMTTNPTSATNLEE